MYACSPVRARVCVRARAHTHLVHLLSSPNMAGAYLYIPNLQGIYIDRYKDR